MYPREIESIRQQSEQDPRVYFGEEFEHFQEILKQDIEQRRLKASAWQVCWKEIQKSLIRPMGIADLVLLAAGVALPLAVSNSENQFMNELAWQIPLSIIAFVALGRFLQMPFRAKKQYDDARKNLIEHPPLTLERVAKELISFQDTVGLMHDDVHNEFEQLKIDTENRLVLMEKHLGVKDDNSNDSPDSPAS